MTTRSLIFTVLLLTAFCAVALAADFNGTWKASIESQVGVQNYTFTFKVEGEKLTGKAKSEFAMTETEISEGTVKGDDISFVENLNYDGMPLKIVYKGKISGDEIKFSRNVADIADEPFVAKRSK
jgi:autotransporter translocation and assembly factor TamB